MSSSLCAARPSTTHGGVDARARRSTSGCRGGSPSAARRRRQPADDDRGRSGSRSSSSRRASRPSSSVADDHDAVASAARARVARERRAEHVPGHEDDGRAEHDEARQQRVADESWTSEIASAARAGGARRAATSAPGGARLLGQPERVRREPAGARVRRATTPKRDEPDEVVPVGDRVGLAQAEDADDDVPAYMAKRASRRTPAVIGADRPGTEPETVESAPPWPRWALERYVVTAVGVRRSGPRRAARRRPVEPARASAGRRSGRQPTTRANSASTPALASDRGPLARSAVGRRP